MKTATEERNRRFVYVVVRAESFPRSDFKLVTPVGAFDTEAAAWNALSGRSTLRVTYTVEYLEIGVMNDI